MNTSNSSFQPVMHRIENPDSSGYKKVKIVALVLVFAGIFTGFGLSKILKTGTNDNYTGGGTGENSQNTGNSKTEQVFPDKAEGALESGGIDGEGTHKLVRSGGESQTVYLTSSVLDLTSYEGKNVRVWGETRAGKKAGWLMDVGKVEVMK